MGWKSQFCFDKSLILPLITFRSFFGFYPASISVLWRLFKNVLRNGYLTTQLLITLPGWKSLKYYLCPRFSSSSCICCNYKNLQWVLRLWLQCVSLYFRTQKYLNNSPKDIDFLDWTGLKNWLLNLIYQKLRRSAAGSARAKSALIVQTTVDWSFCEKGDVPYIKPQQQQRKIQAHIKQKGRKQNRSQNFFFNEIFDYVIDCFRTLFTLLFL